MATEIGQQIEGREVIDQFGTRVGKVDRVMKRPGQDAEWARVKLGRFGVRSAWVPLDQAEISGEDLRMPYGREQIEDAHDIASDDEVSPDQQSRLNDHFTSTPQSDDFNDTETGAETRDRDEATSETQIRDRDADRDRDHDDRTTGRSMGTPAAAVTGTAAMPDVDTVRASQRDEFGGINWGSAFFGWLVAMGLAAILMSIVAAAGASLGLAEAETGAAESLSIGGAVAFLVSLAIAYYAGGYVAGRMSRFDGARQGFAVWATGLVLTLLAAVAGWIVGAEYNILQQLNLPRIPIDEGTLATGAAITLAATALLTLLAAVAGAKVGERYHERVDESTFPESSRRQ